MWKGLVTLLFCNLALAGNDAGNGGEVVLCRTPEGVDRLELMDYYEANVLPPYFVFDVGGAELTVEQHVDYILTRLAKFDPTRASVYRSTVKDLLEGKNVKWVTALTLPALRDSGYVPMVGYCYDTRQVIIQRKPTYPHEAQYVIQKDIWDKLNPVHKAGLALHEAIYKEIKNYRQPNSTNVRRYNAFIASTKMNTLSAADYVAFAEQVFQRPKAVAFQDDSLSLRVSQDVPFAFDMRNFLASQGVPGLQWTFFKLPQGVKLDKSGNLTGTLKYPGTATVIAQQGNYSTATSVTLVAQAPNDALPRWVIPSAKMAVADISKVDLASLVQLAHPDKTWYSIWSQEDQCRTAYGINFDTGKLIQNATPDICTVQVTVSTYGGQINTDKMNLTITQYPSDRRMP